MMFVLGGMVKAQEGVERGRVQLHSLAREIARACRDTIQSVSTLTLRVESAPQKTLVENALIEALRTAGFEVRMAESNSSFPLLHVFVVGHSESRRELDGMKIERTIRSGLDARVELSNGTAVTLGLFSSESRDTLVRGSSSVLPGVTSEEESVSIFEKIAAPVLLITGAFLIVYLFFTVRS